MNQADLLLQTVKRSWWIVAMTLILTLNLVLFRAYNAQPMYQSEASFLLTPSQTLEQDSDRLNSFFPLDSRSLAVTGAEILQSQRVFEEAGAEVGLTPEERANYLPVAVVLPESNVLTLTIRGPHPQTASDLANTMGEISIQYFNELYRVYELQRLDAAAPPPSPYSPTPVRDAVLAVFIGGVLGTGLAVAREYLLFLLSQRNTVVPAA